MFKWFTEWLEKNGFEREDAGAKKSELQIKQAMYATVIRACQECGSPGVDSRGQDVGPVCPVCLTPRPQNENLGRIWSK